VYLGDHILFPIQEEEAMVAVVEEHRILVDNTLVVVEEPENDKDLIMLHIFLTTYATFCCGFTGANGVT
jgi:hypothetical protein